MINIGFVMAIVFGLILGLTLAWAYFSSTKHRAFRNDFPREKLPASLLFSRIVSILFGILFAVFAHFMLLAYGYSVLNAISYACAVLGSVFGSWHFIFKPKLKKKGTLPFDDKKE